MSCEAEVVFPTPLTGVLLPPTVLINLKKMHGFVCVSVCAHSGVCAEDNMGVVFRRQPAGVSFLPAWVQSVEFRSSGLAASMSPAEPSGWLLNKLLA